MAQYALYPLLATPVIFVVATTLLDQQFINGIMRRIRGR